jgi:hypothetical protein
MHRSRRAEDVAHEVKGPRLAGQEAPRRSLRTLDAPDAGRPSGTGRTLRPLGALHANDAGPAGLPRLALQALLTAEALLAGRSDHAPLTLSAGEPRLALAPGLARLALLADGASRASFAGNALFARDAPLARRTLGALVAPVTGEAGRPLRTRLALFPG